MKSIEEAVTKSCLFDEQIQAMQANADHMMLELSLRQCDALAKQHRELVALVKETCRDIREMLGTRRRELAH